MSGGSDEMLKRLSEQDKVDSVIHYEIIRSDDSRFFFNDVIIGGFDGFEEMSETLEKLQLTFPEEISPDVVTAIKNKLPEL